MHPLFVALRKAPLEYLPALSLRAFLPFRSGYFYGLKIEGHDSTFPCHRGYHHWLCERFELDHAEAIADTEIVLSFTANEEEAFYRYFELLEEFLLTADPAENPPSAQMRSNEVGTPDFSELLRQIRRRPGMYGGSDSFASCRAFLMGDERAYDDFKLSGDEGRVIFRDFQRWVEDKKSYSALFRPWHKLIEFYGMSDRGRLTLFFAWLDEYAKTIGKTDLFAVEAPPHAMD
jgi:hypothetical protein